MTSSSVTIEHNSNPAHMVSEHASALSGDLYRYHGIPVFDSEGEPVGIVDWIWTNERNGTADHLGVQLQWLRGKARAVPVEAAVVDLDLQIVALPFSKRQIDSATRFRIDRPLSGEHRATVAAHFTPPISTRRSAMRLERIAA